MPILDEKTTSKAKEMLSEMEGEVTILFFKSQSNQEYCVQTEALVNEVKSLSGKIRLEVFELDKDSGKAKAAEFKVERAPAIILLGKEKRFVRFFGVPTGYEFSTFLSDILDVSKSLPKLPPDLIERIRKIDFPVHIQVFITPTCPYCPGAVKVAHDFALINPNVTGDMVEATEFPELSEKYSVMGVPKTIINETLELVGAYPADIVLKRILELKK
ncbi:MAG: thioredoxin family protein [Candidatus Micrarchaeia archaeon]